MPVYPIAIRKKSMLHAGGTKEYHQVLVVNGKRQAILIQRWGRKGAEGQMRVEIFGRVEDAISRFDEKNHDKAKGGYRHDPARDTTVEAADEAEFRKKLGRMYLLRCGAKNLEALIPGIDTTGVKDPENIEYEEVAPGRMVRKGYQPRNTFTDFVEPPKPSVEEEIAINENWGMW